MIKLLLPLIILLGVIAYAMSKFSTTYDANFRYYQREQLPPQDSPIREEHDTPLKTNSQQALIKPEPSPTVVQESQAPPTDVAPANTPIDTQPPADPIENEVLYPAPPEMAPEGAAAIRWRQYQRHVQREACRADPGLPQCQPLPGQRPSEESDKMGEQGLTDQGQPYDEYRQNP
jgi:hypothetical protein